MLQMLGVFAEFEHGTIVERTKVGMERKAKSGKFVGGNIPYGYQLVPEKGLVINEDEAVLVRKMFRDYVVGRDGVSRITSKLNQAGYRKRSGKVWDKRMVLHMLRNPTYIGKVRWKTVYEGEHQPIIPEDLFRNVGKILKERSEEMKGRQFHNGNSRLLTGIIRCAKCKSPMYGSTGTKKNGIAIPYYVCRKRQVQHACKQDYIRADRLEESLVRDVKSMFQDDKLLDQIWKETNKRLEAEKPDVDKQIKKVEVETTKTRKRIERYFDAFEAGTLQPEVCNEKVQDLSSQVGELEAEKRKLEACRKSLGLPVLDKEHVAELLENFDQVLEAGTGEQKKHLLRKLVKKVLIHEKRKIEVWYRLPNPPNIRTLAHMAPRMCQYTNPQESVQSGVFLRVIHVAARGSAGYVQQAVDLIRGSGSPICTFARRVPTNSNVVARASPRPGVRPPNVVTLLQQAITWRESLDSGQIPNQAAIARQEGITRARVTQILALLRLPPDIRDQLLSSPRAENGRVLTERSLRPLLRHQGPSYQQAALQQPPD